MIEAHYDNPEAMKEIGINYAAQQIIDLITNGVDGIHILHNESCRKQHSVYFEKYSSCIERIKTKDGFFRL